MQPIVQFLLGLGRLENLDCVVADYESCCMVWSYGETCVALSIDFDLAEDVDFVALACMSCFLACSRLFPRAINEWHAT